MKEKINAMIDQAQAALRTGNELEVIRILEEAKELAQRCDEKILLIQILNDISGAKRVCGRYQEAIGELEEAIFIMKSLDLQNTAEFGTTLINIANTYRMKKDFTTAKEYFEQAKQLYINIAQDGFLWASLCNNYSLLLQEMGEFQAAYQYQSDSIETLKKTGRFELPLASSYNNMYKILCDLGRIEEGEAYLLDAKNIYERLVGANHPLYAAAINNLADCFYRKKEFVKAIALYHVALGIIEKNYGKHSEAYTNILQNIEVIESEYKKKDEVDTSLVKNAISLSREFFEEEIEPLLQENLPEVLNIASIGIAGTGSDALGYDDELSKDHDYEIKVILWLSDLNYELYGNELKRLVQRFENGTGETFLQSSSSKNTGCETFKRNESGLKKAVYIEKASDFYKKYTGLSSPPSQLSTWALLPQDVLRIVTGGEIFVNHCSEFKEFRDILSRYYPEDLRIKKMAYCLNKMAQSGQYNYPRALKRNDHVFALFALTEFIEFYLKFLHLVNKKYCPFYKWRFRSAKDLKILAPETLEGLEALAKFELSKERSIQIIEGICYKVIEYLNQNGYSSVSTDFLTYQAQELMKRIIDQTLRQEDSWIERSKDE